MKTAKRNQGTSEVTYTDQQHVGLPVSSEDVTNPLDQFRYAVSYSRVAELPEISQILANLGVGEAQRLTKLTA